MNPTNISLKLYSPVYFQTTKYFGEEDIKQLQTPLQLAPSNNYVFPGGYTLDEMIVDAKKFMQKDNADNGLFYPWLNAEIEIPITNAQPYLDKAKQITTELRTVLGDKVNILSRDEEIIQSCDFEDRAYKLNQSHLRVYDSWRNDSILHSGFFIDGTSKPYHIKLNFGMYDSKKCDIEHMEKFYEATKTIFTKLLE